MKWVINDFRAFRKDYFLMVAIPPALWAIGVAIGVVTVKSQIENTLSCMGTLIGLIGLLVTLFFIGIKQYAQEFNLTIAMGRTRKDFFFGKLAANILCMFFIILILSGLNLGEIELYRYLFPEMHVELTFSIGFNFPIIVLISIAAAVLSMGLGTLFLKFGVIIYWAIWLIWMAACWFGERILRFFAESLPESFARKFMDAVLSLNGRHWMLIGYIFVFLIGVCCAMGVRKQQVTL